MGVCSLGSLLAPVWIPVDPSVDPCWPQWIPMCGSLLTPYYEHLCSVWTPIDPSVNPHHGYILIYMYIYICIYIYTHDIHNCFMHTSDSSYCKRIVAIKRSSSCSSLCLLDMPIRRAWARCPCCEKWIQFTPGCREPDEWCYFCERLWEDWYAKKKWARTVDCMLMLATNSLRDNHYKWR